MKNEFIPYEESLELKQLGFDEPTSFYWENNVIKSLPMKDEVGAFHFNRHSRTENEWICAPLYQQAFRWFRDKYGLCGVVSPHSYEILDQNDVNHEWGCIFEVLCDTYEESELECLKKLIEIIKQKQ